MYIMHGVTTIPYYNTRLHLCSEGHIHDLCPLLFRSFLEWMYPMSGGEESVSDAALGVVILWFCW